MPPCLRSERKRAGERRRPRAKLYNEVNGLGRLAAHSDLLGLRASCWISGWLAGKNAVPVGVAGRVDVSAFKIMAWSLSQEDDGLEPVSGEALAETHAEAQHALGKAPEGGSRGSLRSVASQDQGFSDLTPPSSGSLKVYPVPSRRPRTQEPTLVLRQRQVDSLRAEVHKHRRAAERRQSLTMILWGLAGAVAVLVGALLARALTEPSSEPIGIGQDEPGAGGPVAPMEPVRADSAPKEKGEASLPFAKKAVDRDRRPVLSLDELPTE